MPWLVPRDIKVGDESFQKPCFIGVAHLRGRVSQVSNYSSSCTPTSSPLRRVAVTLSSSDIPSPHPLDGLECLDGSHRVGQGNLIRCTPVLDEGYVPGNFFAKWTARSRWHSPYQELIRKPRRARAQATLVPHSPSLSRLDPWRWERPSFWRLVAGDVYGRRALGKGESRDCDAVVNRSSRSDARCC